MWGACGATRSEVWGARHAIRHDIITIIISITMIIILVAIIVAIIRIIIIITIAIIIIIIIIGGGLGPSADGMVAASVGMVADRMVRAPSLGSGGATWPPHTGILGDEACMPRNAAAVFLNGPAVTFSGPHFDL